MIRSVEYSAAALSTARVVADRYTLIRPIGRGSTAVVYVAKDGRSGQNRAVKLLPARPGLRPDEAAAFATEIMGVVEHPGLVDVIDAGIDGDGKTLFLVMPLLHGSTLRDLIDDPSKRDIEERINLLEGILDPLAAAHDRGWVHGSLTAGNVFDVRTRDGVGRPRLLDLGLEDVLSRGNFGASSGPPASPNMAPERAGGARFGPTADVWSFGVMLYEACSGSLPFAGVSKASLVRSISDAPHRPLDLVCPDVDAQIARLVDLCLDKRPGQRPNDGRALLRLLKALRRGLGSGASADVMTLNTVIDRVGAAPSPPPDDLDAALRRSPRDPQVHRALLAHYQAEEIHDGAWLTATALDFLGQASREEIRLHHHYRRPNEIAIDRGLDAGGWAALLHPDQDPRVDAVWREIVPAIAKLHRRTDEDAGLTKARKIDVARADDELAEMFRLAVGALRPAIIPRLYRTKAGSPPKYLPTGPAASAFGRGFEEPLPAGALPFAVGRHIAHYRSAHRVCTFLLEADALESVFGAGVRLGRGEDPQTQDEQRMMELLASNLSSARRDSLRAACARLGLPAAEVDLGTWRRAVELGCCRAGLALGGNLEGATWMLRWTRERRRLPTEDAVDDLLRFWSSGNHVRVRHLLGIGIE